MIEEPLARSAILGVLQELIHRPSVNPTLSPQEGHGEAAVAAFAMNWLVRNSVTSSLEEVALGRPNVIGQVGKRSGPTLVFCAPLDTVGTDGMPIPPFEAAGGV